MMDETNNQDLVCYGPGSIAGAVVGTFFTTILLICLSVFFCKKWRRHKGKHLVLVTDPEIVEDAYAFDNPCFKEAMSTTSKSMDRPLSVAVVETQIKDGAKWSTPWSGFGIALSNKQEKRRTLDDSYLGPKATRVNVVSLRSRDFTGLGFNVCGNMREGIFIKDLLHRGPASESGLINAGDRIASVKISFRSMVYEDALTILSYASPYDVELQVESGGTESRSTILLKKSVGSSPNHICHPLYRSQSIPEFSRAQKSSAKRLFIADPNDSLNSNYSPINSPLKSTKSTPGTHTNERKHEEVKSNHQHKFGIKVLPALDGTVHRIENQNEHNTNLERKNSRRKIDPEKRESSSRDIIVSSTPIPEKVTERFHQSHNNNNNNNNNNKNIREKVEDKPDGIVILSEVPAEVHNAAMAARRNRKYSAELLSPFKLPASSDVQKEEPKSPQKNKRKAPAPPSPTKDNAERKNDSEIEDRIDTIADYTQSLNDYVEKISEADAEMNKVQEQNCVSRMDDHLSERRNSESDTDSEMQHSFTTIELNPSDITIHHTPVPREENYEDNEDDEYRKAASLGDLSKYEAKGSATLERAQSLDMADAGTKKRKAPLPPDDIAEFNKDLPMLDDIEAFDKRKLKKSNEWGTLEDAIWNKTDLPNDTIKSKARKKSNGTLERSKSAVEIKIKEENLGTNDVGQLDDKDCSIELYNLPLSKSLTRDFIRAERMFNPDEDNSLARIVNNGRVLKSPTPDKIELDFKEKNPMSDDSPNDIESYSRQVDESFDKALRAFDLDTRLTGVTESEIHIDMLNGDHNNIYEGMEEVKEEPIHKITVNHTCPGCEQGVYHDEHCQLHIKKCNDESLEVTSDKQADITDIEKQIIQNIPIAGKDGPIEDGHNVGSSVTVISMRISPIPDQHISNVSVSSGETSEDSGWVAVSGEFNTDLKPPLPNTPAPSQESFRKLTYITEIKVTPKETTQKVNLPQISEILPKPPRGQVTITSNGEPTPGKKPPVPPRRNDVLKSKDNLSDKQVVFVSEYKSPEKSLSETGKNIEKSEENKKFDPWIFVHDSKN